MKRIVMIVVAIGAMAGIAFAQGPRALAGRQEPVQQKQGPLQQSIIALYLSDLRGEVGLTDEQFISVEPIVRQFIRQRFSIANQRQMLDARKEQLLNQPNPSPADLQTLNDELAKLDNNHGTWKSRFMQMLRPQLTEYQRTRTRDFNDRFIDEKLPALVDNFRAQNPARGVQERPAAVRANQNRKGAAQPGSPVDTLRGQDAAPVTPRGKLPR